MKPTTERMVFNYLKKSWSGHVVLSTYRCRSHFGKTYLEYEAYFTNSQNDRQIVKDRSLNKLLTKLIKLKQDEEKNY